MAQYLVQPRNQIFVKGYGFYFNVWSDKKKENKNPKVARVKNERIMLLSKCAVCNSKKLKIYKQQEARGLLSSLELETSLRKIPLWAPLLF